MSTYETAETPLSLEYKRLAELWVLKTIAIVSTHTDGLKEDPNINKLLTYLNIEPRSMVHLRVTPASLNEIHISNFFDTYNIFFYGVAKMTKILNAIRSDVYSKVTITKHAKILPKDHEKLTDILMARIINLRSRLKVSNTPSYFFTLPEPAVISNSCGIYITAMAELRDSSGIVDIDTLMSKIPGPDTLKEALRVAICNNKCQLLKWYFSMVNHALNPPIPNTCLLLGAGVSSSLVGVPNLYIIDKDPKLMTDRFY